MRRVRLKVVLGGTASTAVRVGRGVNLKRIRNGCSRAESESVKQDAKIRQGGLVG